MALVADIGGLLGIMAIYRRAEDEGNWVLVIGLSVFLLFVWAAMSVMSRYFAEPDKRAPLEPLVDHHQR